jgi:co-chaperonin GroES (HSP10)
MSKLKNTSGLRPVEYKILILPDAVEETSAGGIIKPSKAHETEQWAQVKGTLVAIGGKAFIDWPDEEREVLKPGARVYYRKYEGIVISGADGEEYRLCTDKDVGGVVENESAIQGVQGRSRVGLDAA